MGEDWWESDGDFADLRDGIFPAVHNEGGRVGGQDDLRVGIQFVHHCDEALLPFEVQTRFGLVHEEHVGLLVLREHGQEDEQYLLLAAGEFVGREGLVVLNEGELVALAVDAFARFAEVESYGYPR